MHDLWLARVTCCHGSFKLRRYLVELEVTEDFDYLSSDDKSYANGFSHNIVPAQTVSEVENILGPIGDTMFMTFLGLHYYAFECFNNIDLQKELIVPSSLFGNFRVVTVTPVRYNLKRFAHDIGEPINF